MELESRLYARLGKWTNLNFFRLILVGLLVLAVREGSRTFASLVSVSVSWRCRGLCGLVFAQDWLRMLGQDL